MIIKQVLDRDYQGLSPEQVSADIRFHLAADLQKKYRLAVEQLTAGLSLPTRLVAQALRSKQYR